MRSFRHWQLKKLQRLIYESHYPLDMHLRFRNQRRIHIAPNYNLKLKVHFSLKAVGLSPLCLIYLNKLC